MGRRPGTVVVQLQFELKSFGRMGEGPSIGVGGSVDDVILTDFMVTGYEIQSTIHLDPGAYFDLGQDCGSFLKGHVTPPPSPLRLLLLSDHTRPEVVPRPYSVTLLGPPFLKVKTDPCFFLLKGPPL